MNYSASLLDPDDEVELTLVADVAGVGRTHKLVTGQVVEWDAASLRKFAPSMIGMPVNADVDNEGELGGHSRRVIGAVTQASFDEGRGVVQVKASLWRHYNAIVDRIKELWQAGKLAVSMEHTPKELVTNADGSVTPSAGRFSGLGLVRNGADPRAHVLLLAAAEDPVGSDAWVTRLVAADQAKREQDAKQRQSVQFAPADLERVATEAAERYNARLQSDPADPHEGHPRARRDGVVYCLSCG